MERFSEKEKLEIAKSGWYEGRHVDTSSVKDVFLKEGYTWTVPVDDFLKEFGFLKIPFILSNGSVSFMHFDPNAAIASIDSSWILDDYSARLAGEKLCPIGQAFGGHFTLIMSEAGKVYGGYDDLLYFVGDNGRTAIINLLKGPHNFAQIS